MNSTPEKAQYLLRFDDLCPTMDRAKWQRLARLITRYGLRPILAVVPDNQDPDLQISPADGSFWEEMRGLEGTGATIGLHGYQHLCGAGGRSLVPRHVRTEFAGVSRELQREWIGKGLELLRSQELRPRVWVAPRHGMDLVTLAVLQEKGIAVVSDGLAERPYWEHGMIWIPQQLWGPVEKVRGLWTICIHANTATDEEVTQLEVFLKRHFAQFTSLEWALAEWPIIERTLSDRLFHRWAVLRSRPAVRRLRPARLSEGRRG
jgi:predicted deacetylase